MDALPPPSVSIQAHAPIREVRDIRKNDEQAQATLIRLRQHNPGTNYLHAWMSEIPGLVAVQLADNSVAYTDLTGRFLILGIAFDFDTGKILNFKDGVSTVSGTTDLNGANNE